MIVIEVDGIQYGNFNAATVGIRLDALTKTFGFEATSEGARPLPFVGGESCLIFVAGEQVLSGHIEVVNAAISSQDHRISITGRDKLGDLLDSSLSSDDIKAPTLSALCARVLKEIGLVTGVVDEVVPEPFNPAEDISAPDPGENAFEFLQKYSRKRGVLLTSDFDANLVITRASGIETGGLIQNRKDDRGGANNVVAGEVSYDETGRFNLYRTAAQLNPTAGALAGLLGAKEVASQTTKDVIDRGIRQGRQMVLVSEAMTGRAGGLDRATWEANMRRARGRAYSPELAGFVDQEENLWAVNTLPQVDDDDAAIQARMLINQITFSNSVGEGEKTVLGMVERDSYTLALAEPVAETDTSSTGGGLAGLLA